MFIIISGSSATINISSIIISVIVIVGRRPLRGVAVVRLRERRTPITERIYVQLYHNHMHICARVCICICVCIYIYICKHIHYYE